MERINTLIAETRIMALYYEKKTFSTKQIEYMNVKRTCITRSSWRKSSCPFSRKACSSPSLPLIVNFRGRCLDVMTTSWGANDVIVTTGESGKENRDCIRGQQIFVNKCVCVCVPKWKLPTVPAL